MAAVHCLHGMSFTSPFDLVTIYRGIFSSTLHRNKIVFMNLNKMLFNWKKVVMTPSWFWICADSHEGTVGCYWLPRLWSGKNQCKLHNSCNQSTADIYMPVICNSFSKDFRVIYYTLTVGFRVIYWSYAVVCLCGVSACITWDTKSSSTMLSDYKISVIQKHFVVIHVFRKYMIIYIQH